MSGAGEEADALPPDSVAIVGMAGRFPGATDVAALWALLCEGREGLATLTEAELRAEGLSAAEIADPKLVRVTGAITDYDRFDAEFFGLNPREAEMIDPQHRVFFECAWSALENAGIDPTRAGGSVGVFAGANLNTYLLHAVVPNPEKVAAMGMFGTAIASDKDALTQRLAYALNLRGPAVTVQTACSTSLVAVQLAVQSLQNFQCDTALAGGVSVKVPHRTGYHYTEGGVASPDGRCRPFDAGARGTVPANGCGVVVLRRLDDALAEGDDIIAVIRGAAVNNDGAHKVGFTAPGVEGQAAVIALAQAAAGVRPESIGFIEAHGTATPLGDPIEVAALGKIFGRGAGRAGRCALGSVKSNVGHLDAAAGVTGLIKAALAVRAGTVPATVHFTAANAELGLETTPFFVNASAVAWPVKGGPRRAGVSSFGIGGTNAHVVLEQAPERVETAATTTTAAQWWPVSARTATALAQASANLAEWLDAHPTANLADVARTLQRGRRGFAVRRVVRATTAAEAAAALRAADAGPSAGAGMATEIPAAIRAWCASAESAWPEEFTAAGRTVALPAYPFERSRHWIDTPVRASASAAEGAATNATVRRDVADWIYRAAWRRGVVRRGEAGAGRAVLDLGGYAVAESVAALRMHATDGALRELVVVVDGVLAVEGGDVSAPELAAVLGFVQVLRQERPTVRWRVLDAGGLTGAERAAAAEGEWGAPDDETVVAWRGGRRWIRGWDAVPTADAGSWRDGGVFIISGGFGRLGLAIADALARAGRVRLVLIGRRGASGAEERVRALEATGAEVLAVAADVADEVAMRGAVATADARWGAVHGVIHAAGLTGAESVRAAAETDEAMRAALWHAKVAGWRALDAALAGRTLDFRLAITSLAAVVGGPGLGAYAAANAALDALAEQSATRTDGTGWSSVAWGGNGGAAMDGATGAEVLRRIAARGEPGAWVVAMTDLRAWLRASAPTLAASAAPVAVSRAEAERVLAEIWSAAVGAVPATWEQNFFEAGGDSLSAVQVVAQINRRFGTELTVAAFLNQPTVAAVAARVAPDEVAAAEATGARVRRGALRRERRGGGEA